MTPAIYKGYQRKCVEYYNTVVIDDVMEDLKKGGLLNQNSKLSKTDGSKVVNYGLEMVPADVLKGISNTCEYAGACKITCIWFTGQANMFNSKSHKMSNVMKKRIRRQWFYNNYPDMFREILRADIISMDVKSRLLGYEANFRLNVVSDIDWVDLVASLPTIKFYDYTKHLNRIPVLPNYVLTYSYSEKMSDDMFHTLIRNGHNVAVVFLGNKLPVTFKGVAVVNGDDTDNRYEDPRAVVVGLIQKASIGGKSTKANKFMIDVKEA